MRKYIDIVNQTLIEGADFHPAVKTIENGETYVNYPPDSSHQVEGPCDICNGTGLDNYYYEYHSDETPDVTKHPCECCMGAKTMKEWKYEFPSMRIPHMQIEILCNLLGTEWDYSGWIEPSTLPELRRRLIRMMNGDTDYLTSEPTDERKTVVDRSGDIPRITQGARMIGGGISNRQVSNAIERMLEIIDWAQKHNCGVSWA